MMTWDFDFTIIFQTLAEILAAGVAITAFSLLLYALTFNLKDRVARSYAIILTCVVIVFSSEAMAGSMQQRVILEWMLRAKWVGIVFIPASYLHFSDALLTITGQPSRGKRRLLVWLSYLFSFILVLLIPLNILVGPVNLTAQPAPYLATTFLTNLFVIYYVAMLLLATYNFVRAFKRTVTRTSRRRMIYLLAGAIAPAIGSFPYLMYGFGWFADKALTYWALVAVGSMFVGILLVIMAYAVAFFGVTWTDRVVKARLFKWLLRGPFTASLTLGVTTIVRRLGVLYGSDYNAFVPIIMILTILVFEYLITLMSPLWERLLFYGSDRENLTLIRSLEDHLLTQKDLAQFLEIVAALICDRLQVGAAFIAVINSGGIFQFVKAGNGDVIDRLALNEKLMQPGYLQLETQNHHEFINYEGFRLYPLIQKDEQDQSIVLGVCGFPWEVDQKIEPDQAIAIHLLIDRVSAALRDRLLQQQVISSLRVLDPQVMLIQQLSAASRYDRSELLAEQPTPLPEDFSAWVKDALVHYWGGPKLTNNPLLGLTVVKNELDEGNNNEANALRSILKRAIEQVKPEGERRFTGDWVLYNILEMKFVEGRKVREVASRLAMSEADLYRKQRVAIEAVANAINEMEKDLHHNQHTGSVL